MKWIDVERNGRRRRRDTGADGALLLGFSLGAVLGPAVDPFPRTCAHLRTPAHVSIVFTYVFM